MSFPETIPGKNTLEKSIEDRGVNYAKEKGCLVFKVSFAGRAGAADRIHFCQGTTFFIEYKRPKKAHTAKLQIIFQRDLERQGIPVYLYVDDLDLAKKIIDWHAEGNRDKYIIPEGLS